MKSGKTMMKGAAAVLALAGLIAIGFIVTGQRTASRRQSRPGRANSTLGGGILQSGDNLQEAIKNARLGDTIVLQAGATFIGPIILPDKGPGTGTEADYITIRTSDLAGIPKEGQRIKPDLHAANMPKIVAPNALKALGTDERSHHYKFVGIEFTPGASSSYVYNLIDLGASDYSSVSQ